MSYCTCRDPNTSGACPEHSPRSAGIHLLNPPDPNQHLIGWIEELLASAKEGNLVAMISVLGFRNQTVNTAYSFGKYSSPVKMLGELEYRKQIIIEWMRDFYDEAGLNGHSADKDDD